MDLSLLVIKRGMTISSISLMRKASRPCFPNILSMYWYRLCPIQLRTGSNGVRYIGDVPIAKPVFVYGDEVKGYRAVIKPKNDMIYGVYSFDVGRLRP